MRSIRMAKLILIEGGKYAKIGADKFNCLNWLQTHPSSTAEEISAATGSSLKSVRVYMYELQESRMISAAECVEHGHLRQRYTCLLKFVHLEEFHQL